MAAAVAPTSLLPRLSTPILSRAITLRTRGSILSSLPSWTLAVPASLGWSFPSLPTLLGTIWESVLRAVPKKKTSHMKKRHRQMAGKALKDVNALCKCPVCGGTKLMHRVCSNCVGNLRRMLRQSAEDSAEKSA